MTPERVIKGTDKNFDSVNAGMFGEAFNAESALEKTEKIAK